MSKTLPAGAVVILHANDIMPTNADGVMPFKQQSDLFYLTGIDQEETVLVMAPDHENESMREMLFVKLTSEEIAIWEGQKLTKDEASAISGIETVHWLDAFQSQVASIIHQSETIYLYTNEHDRSSSKVETRNDRFLKEYKANYPLHNFGRLALLLAEQRAVKASEEIDALQIACNITEAGFRQVLKHIRPGIREYELEAVLSYEFLKRGSRGFAYTPIIAAGANSCVLHYVQNDQLLESGQLVLMDVGAEYGNYNADLTRTVPVNGKFTERQKQVYEAVLRVKKEATQMLVPGTLIAEYHKEVGKVVEKELIQLDLLDAKQVEDQDPKNPLYKKYFMHGTSHHLGIDVHDVPPRHLPLKPGMVLTVEPGIYIREEGLGIRIEDDVVVTEGQPVNLMENIPIEVEEIEDCINQ